jgi:cell division protein ZapA
MSSESVTVKIFGESYPLRTNEPAARLEELARYVDARMREVAASGKVVVTSKIAVLAALHIADELFRLREERPEPAPAAMAGPGEDDARLARLVERLDAVLAPPAPAGDP